MTNEKLRIASLAKPLLSSVIPGHRLPVKKILTSQFSSHAVVAKMCSGQTNLILCHGHAHPKHSYLPSSGLYVDLNPVAHPDLLGNIRNSSWMSAFPPNHFDLVWLTYIPPPSPFAQINHVIYQNINRLLKVGGVVKSYYLLKMYYNKKRFLLTTKGQILNKIKFHAAALGFDARIDGALVILTKL